MLCHRIRVFLACVAHVQGACIWQLASTERIAHNRGGEAMRLVQVVGESDTTHRAHPPVVHPTTASINNVAACCARIPEPCAACTLGMTHQQPLPCRRPLSRASIHPRQWRPCSCRGGQPRGRRSLRGWRANSRCQQQGAGRGLRGGQHRPRGTCPAPDPSGGGGCTHGGHQATCAAVFGHVAQRCAWQRGRVHP